MSIFLESFKQTCQSRIWKIVSIICALSSLISLILSLLKNEKFICILLYVSVPCLVLAIIIFFYHLYKNYKSLQTKYQSLQTEHQSLQTEHQSLQTEHQSLQTEHQSLQTKYQSLQTKYQSLQTEHQSFKENDIKDNPIWGEIIKGLYSINANINQIERKKKITDQDIATVLRIFCNNVKELLDKKTNSDCCISIKLPVNNYQNSKDWDNMVVENISRDQKHIQSRDTLSYRNATHNIEKNTPYQYIVNSLRKGYTNSVYYINDDVKSDKSYQTSSERTIIPYESELVVPIIPSIYNSLSDFEFGGFLCVDSDVKNSFKSDSYYVPILIGLADELYSVIKRSLKLNKNNRVK